MNVKDQEIVPEIGTGLVQVRGRPDVWTLITN